MVVVFDKAEAARSLVESIEAHHESFDFTASSQLISKALKVEPVRCTLKRVRESVPQSCRMTW